MVEGKMKLNIMKKLLVIGADQKILNVIDNGNNIIIVTQFSDDTSSILYFNYDINILTTKQVDKAYASTAKGSSFFYLKYDMKSKKHYIMGTIDFTYYKQYAQIQS